MIKVLNRKDPEAKGGFNIMRGTALGNPFVIGEHGNREEVIEKYRQWLWGQMNQDVRTRALDVLLYLAVKHSEGEDIKLVCCCKPLACHGDIVKRAIGWLAK